MAITTAKLGRAAGLCWEAFLGIYLTFKGFRPSPILAEGVVPAAP
jgi:hypothetical protein